MSFDTFSAAEDNKTKKDFSKNLAEKQSEEQPIKKSLPEIKLPKKVRETSKSKQSISFSITPEQLEKFERIARKRGYKNRSEFLADIIESID